MVIILQIVLSRQSESQLRIHDLSIDTDLYTCEPINCEFVSQIITCDTIVVDLVGAVLHTMVGMEFESIGEVSNFFFFV